MFDEDTLIDSYISQVILPDMEEHKKNPQEGINLEELTRRLEAHHVSKTGLAKNAA